MFTMKDRLKAKIKKNAMPAVLVALLLAAALAYQRGLLTDRTGQGVRERIYPLVFRVLTLYREGVIRQGESVGGMIRKSPREEDAGGGQGRHQAEPAEPSRAKSGPDEAKVRPHATSVVPKPVATTIRKVELRPVAFMKAVPVFTAGDIVYHGSRDDAKIALTFDAGSPGGSADLYHRLLDTLHDYRTPATFFLTGQFAAAHTDVVQRISRIPVFEIGNHTYGHQNMSKLKADAARADMASVQDAIRGLTGYTTVLFRPPYGEYNDSVVEAARDLGMKTVLWDVSPQDYQMAAGGRIASLVLEGARNGSIVLLHMRGDSAATVEALPAIIDGLRAKGYMFVTVSALIRPAQPRARIIPVGAGYRESPDQGYE